MRIFLTGGTGFIGTHALAALIERGHAVLALARRPEILEQSRASVQAVSGDLAEPSSWEKQLETFEPEACLHLAWEDIPDYSSRASAKNLAAGLRLFEMLAGIGCKKIVSAGSCWEYGKKQGALDEATPLDLSNPFARAKHFLHTLGQGMAEEAGMTFVWARPFYVYGPGQKSSSLVPSLIASREKSETPQLRTPDAGNDFIYVGDVAEALALLVGKPVSNGTYNIGSGVLTPVSRVVNLVYGKTLVPEPEVTQGFWADTSVIAAATGWRTRTSIEDGIQKTIASYEQS